MSRSRLLPKCSNRQEKIVPMSDMDPCDVGYVMDGRHKGSVVLRTPNDTEHEVMVLSDLHVGRFWDGECTLPVRLLRPGEVVVIEFSG